MINLKNQKTQELIGELTEEQLQFLIDQLVEEDSRDQDYYINRDQIDVFIAAGADEALIQMLKDAMGEDDDIDIIWNRD